MSAVMPEMCLGVINETRYSRGVLLLLLIKGKFCFGCYTAMKVNGYLMFISELAL